jgi:hypothetical protein
MTLTEALAPLVVALLVVLVLCVSSADGRRTSDLAGRRD